MKILFLGPKKEPQIILKDFLVNEGDSATIHNKKLNKINFTKCEYDFLISFGYSFIISREIIDYFKGRIINLHISYLPWNKGADPNLWSILENTSKGVTIHHMDYGLDTGKILCQKEIFFNKDDTLKTSYDILQTALLQLFKVNWQRIRQNKLTPIKQRGQGSYHKSSDKNDYIGLLTSGWDTKIKDLEGKAINV